MQRKKTEAEKKRKKKAPLSDSNAAASDTSHSEAVVSNPVAPSEKRKPIQPSRPAASATTSIFEGDGKIAQWVEFLREVKIELGKVVWPTRKQTVGSTVVVIILVMLLSAFLGAVDVCLSWAMQLFI
ncbi:MAG: preprotein translocase subunit SecE [Deltaproteobacteria bacterium]|nr:MAG: preprotein translocase subunit SecE [Deltaproteobacteria bacterium]